MSNMKTAAIYARISLKDKNVPKVEQQEEQCRALAQAFLEYIDLEPQHATASVVNLVEVTNLGIGADGKEGNGVKTYEDSDSIQKYGLHKEALTVNVGTRKALYDDEGELEQYVSDNGLDLLMTDLVTAKVDPRLTIKKIVWNAQQDLEAPQRLELGQRVIIRFRGQEYEAQIAFLEHDISPTRWLVTITLRLP